MGNRAKAKILRLIAVAVAIAVVAGLYHDYPDQQCAHVCAVWGCKCP
jgi:hypothetical protein